MMKRLALQILKALLMVGAVLFVLYTMGIGLLEFLMQIPFRSHCTEINYADGFDHIKSVKCSVVRGSLWISGIAGLLSWISLAIITCISPHTMVTAITQKWLTKGLIAASCVIALMIILGINFYTLCDTAWMGFDPCNLGTLLEGIFLQFVAPFTTIYIVITGLWHFISKNQLSSPKARS